MPLLFVWHPAGESAESPPSYALIDSAVTISDVELYLIAPGAAASTRVEASVTEIKLVQGPLGQDVLTVKGAWDSALCTTMHSGTSAAYQKWAGWIMSLYVRQTLVFDGPVEAWATSWAGSLKPGETWATPGSDVILTAIDWTQALCRRRVVETSTGAKYSKTDTPNRIFADLIRTNMVTGSVITPTSWQVGTETRDDFGDITVACAVPTATGTSITYKRDCGDNLHDAIMELCNSMEDPAEWLWPVATRSGTTVTFTVLVGRSGGSRQIGTDRTTAASGMLGGGAISAERGNLASYSVSGDRVTKANHYTGTGRGRGAGMRRSYAADATDIAALGVYEDWGPVASAESSAEIDVELARLMNERTAGGIVRKFGILEMPGTRWPTDFQRADTLPIYTPLGESLSEVAMGIVWTLVAPGPARVEIDLGQWPPLPERDLGRSGGGGRGGRGGGGRPRSKSPEAKVDPDDLLIYSYAVPQTGSSTAAANTADTIYLEGYDSEEFVRVRTFGASDPDTIQDEVIADYTDLDADVTARGFIKIKNASGTTIWVLATDTNPTP